VPNTLAHLGVQALATRSVSKTADLKWICLGCVIPDVPWILQRLADPLPGGISPYDLRLYAIAQSSLAISLVLCGAFAVLAKRPRIVFAILAANCLMHLLLDALQIKWGNGAHLFAPASWRLVNFGIFWPESLPTVLMTTGGLAWILYLWRNDGGIAIDMSRDRRQLVTGGMLALAYLLLPLTLLDGPLSADNHSVKTLREADQRPGKFVQFDRNSYTRGEGFARIRTFAGEEIDVLGIVPAHGTTLSAKGRFVSSGAVELSEIRTHWPWARDAASVAGLLLVALVWLKALRDTMPGRRRGSS